MQGWTRSLLRQTNLWSHLLRSTIWQTDPHWGGLEATLGHVSWTSQSTSPEDFSNQLRLTLLYFTLLYLSRRWGWDWHTCLRERFRRPGNQLQICQSCTKKKYPIEISIPKKSPPPSTKKMSSISRQIKKAFREKSEIFRRIYSLPFSHLMDHEVCSEVGSSSARGGWGACNPRKNIESWVPSVAWNAILHKSVMVWKIYHPISPRRKKFTFIWSKFPLHWHWSP